METKKNSEKFAKNDSLSDARDALNSIPPDVCRDEWIRAGMGAKAAGLEFDDFDSWSARAPDKYKSADVRSAWKSFDGNGGIGPGTLYRLAADRGWRKNGPHVTPRARVQRPGMSPAEVWARFEPATAAHQYIVAKGLAGMPLDNLRVVPAGDPLRIPRDGERMAGALVIPAYAPGGNLQSLQFVTVGDTAARLKAQDKPTKFNLPGAPMAGASFTVGTLVPGVTVHVGEGLGSAGSCWQADGNPAVACFGWSNVARVVRELLQRDPSARPVIVPDVGKEESAAKIARELGCAVAYMPANEPNNFDANDLAQRDGHDVLAALLESAAVHSDNDAVPSLPIGIVFADQLGDAYNPPDELVQGLLTMGDGAMLYGDSNSGKTFFAIDLACAVARGVEWHGRKVEPGLVMYVASESPGSVRGRLQAYQQHHGCKVPNFAIVQSPIDLFSDGECQASCRL